MIHFHTYGKWGDVDVKEVIPVGPMLDAYVICRIQVIKQQRRCSVCNIVKTRHSA